MKKFYILLLTVAVSTFSFGQTFYSENMGTTASGTIPIATNVFQNSSPIIYSGDGDTRATAVSTGYVGASGVRNVFLTSTAGKFFQISGLNTSAYTTANLQLSFGYVTSSTSLAQLVVETSIDGTTWLPLTFSQNPNTSWNLVTIAAGQIPSSTTLSLRFTQPATAQMRIDDVKLTNVSASCLLALAADTTTCEASTLAIDTYTATIPFAGGGTATYVISTTSGTVAGDNPSSSATGNITITGINEGTNITVTITGGTCNLSRDITAPECKTINALPYSENFNYTVASSLGAQQMWTNVNSGDAILAVAGNLAYTGVTASGNSVSFSGGGIDTFSPFTTTTTGTVYTSFLMNVTDMALVTADGSESVFATLTDDLKGFNARIFVKRSSATQFQVGCTSVSALPAAATIYGATLYNVGDVVMVIAGYDFATNQLKLWLNPTLATFTAATPATITETPTVPFTNLGGFLLRQDADNKTPTMTIDELRVATTTTQLAVTQNEINGLSMYPNPVVNGNLYITTDTNASKEVAIFDVLGKQVVKTTVTNQAVNVANLKGGIYIVKITEEGKTATRKLIIR